MCFTRLAQASIFSFVTLCHNSCLLKKAFCISLLDMMQNSDVQHMEGEEGSIGATGALASSLGSVIANPLESADLPSTGIPFVSTNDESLPAV